MLTPVDISNRVFKGGIGYDKKDVEAFMAELSTDYKELYSSNVELKDKVTTLNESLQHYRSIEDSMQKALTLSEKTAEETVGAANDRARQINTEAELKAEAMLADARAELQETKDAIYQLQKHYELFKKQFSTLLDQHSKYLMNEIDSIELGEDFIPSNASFAGFSGGGSLGGEGGLGGLGAGTYTGSSDSGRERTNQEPAFDRGALNMDPFTDAANGGGRFSKQTGGKYTNSNKNTNAKTSNGSNNSLNVKEDAPKSTKVKRNISPSAAPQAQATPKPQAAPQAQATPKPQAAPQPQATPQPQPAPKPQAAPQPQPAAKPQAAPQPQPAATKTVSKEEVLAAIKAAAEAAEYEEYKEAPDTTDDSVVNGEVEGKIRESNMIDSEDNYSEGFDFVSEETDDTVMNGEVESRINESNMIDSEDNYSEGFDFIAEETTTQFSYEPEDDDTYTGEVETRVNESNMIDSEDNYSNGFDFVVDEEPEEEIPTIMPGANMNTFNNTDDDVLSGDVEDKVNQSNLIGNDDDDNEGFNFV